MGVIYAENGTVLRSFVGTNQKATDNRHMFQATLTQAKDNQNIESRQHAGFRSRAPVGSKLYVCRFSDHYKLAIAEDDGITQQIADNETIVYGSDGYKGSVVCYLHFKTDGNIDMVANAAINLTAPDDVTIKSGNLIVEENILCNGEITAYATSTPYSMTGHPHYPGNLGFNTGAALPDTGAGGVPIPSPAPSYDSGTGDIIDGNGTKSTNHTHSQGDDGGGDAEVDTGAAHTP
jgi:hypothetical protein